MSPAYCWLPGPATRNQFVLFERSFELPAVPESARWSVFTDTRYRAWVNQRIVGYGPARFHPLYPEFDTYDLAPFLRSGENRILVEAWSAGSANFQSIIAPGAFWSQGRIDAAGAESILLDSPGDWRARRSVARRADAVPLSFAIGPVEILDWGILHEECACINERPMAHDTGHGPPQPRTLPAPCCQGHAPSSVTFQGQGSTDGEIRWGAFRWFRDFVPGYEGARTSSALCATWLYSPEAQALSAGLFWSDAWLNGEQLIRIDVPGLGNRQNTELRLEAGWNFFIASFPVPGEVWGLPLGLPAHCGIRPLLNPESNAKGGFWMTRLLNPDEEARLNLRGCRELPTDLKWEAVPADSISLAPAREVGWDAPNDLPSVHPIVTTKSYPIHTGAEGLAILTFAFEKEFYGHPAFELETATACTVDVSVSEALRRDRTIDGFSTLFSVHSTDRYHLGPGTHKVEGFHNRGGRYLQLNVRTRPNTAVIVRSVDVKELKTPFQSPGDFRCDSGFWNWCWAASRDTLNASLEDIWSDSPWREQGCYLGDSLVQFHAHACLSADMRIPARILRLWAQCQNPDGQIPAVVPAHMTRPHPDFTLLYVKFVRDYWAWTGDVSLVQEVWPAIERILGSSGWKIWTDGLVSTDAGPLFIDWSVEADARMERSSVLNALWIHAHECASEIAQIVGADPVVFQTRADRARTAFCLRFWDEATGRFVCTILADDSRIPGRNLHGNALAFAWNIGSPEQHSRILPWLLKELDDNAEKIIRHRESQPTRPRTTSGQIEPYFLFFLLDAMALGRLGEAARKIVKDTWGIMRDQGATTLWESVVQTYFNDGSRCHSWAAAPLIYASRAILGVRRPVAGDPDEVMIQPVPSGCRFASGIAAHPRGDVRVDWKLGEDTFEMSVSHPAGLRINTSGPEGIPKERCRIRVVAYQNDAVSPSSE